MRQTRPRSRTTTILAAAWAAVLLALAGPGPADANLIGDPTLTNGAGRFGFGAELDFVTDRDLDEGGDFETNRLLANGSYGFLDNVDAFVKLGLFNGEASPNIDIDPGLAIGFGGRASFLNQGDVRFGVLAQVLYFSSELDAPQSPDIDWIELDIAPAVSFRGLGQIVPYGGVKFSWLDGDVEGVDFENDDMLGVFGGASFAVSPDVNIGAEVRLLDETAFGVYANFKF